MTVAAPRRGRDQSRLNLIDYGLMAIGSGLAAYTAGMSIGRDDTAQFLATAVFAGTALSYVIRTLLGSTAVVKVDGILYAAAILCAIVGFQTLNGFLPEEGFARDVMMAGILAWMIVLGSVVTWRDGTLLFQAIPSVALFGLVGCYDTYAAAPYLFFGFLVCLAIVLARANRREMMRQAVESGYFNRADAPSAPQEFPEQSAELYEDILRGPWRWQAGPEWALASALVIVLLSRLGAPAIQEAAKPITQQFRILTPTNVRNRVLRDAGTTQPNEYVVGRGPLGKLSDHVVYNAQLDRPRYLRTAAYEVYTGRGWTRSWNGTDTVRASIQAMGDRKRKISFGIQPTDDRERELPLPAETVALGTAASKRPDGGGEVSRGWHGFIEGTLVEPTETPRAVPDGTDDIGGETTNASRVPERVREFAKSAASGSKDAYDAAGRIATAIAAQVRYNIEAAAVPSNVDPVEWFLFTNREGYCDLFASSMTLCARSVGLPARYVIGYLPEMSDGKGNYAIREADYHAWCEVFFKGVGWVVFDATEGAAQVEGGERGSSDSSRPWYTAAWIAPAVRGIMVVMALGLGFYVLRGLKPKARPDRWETHRAYAGFERTLRRALGRRRHPGETVEAYASASKDSAGEAAVPLGIRFARALYGPHDPTEEELKSLREATRALRRK